jgi:transposase
MSEKDFYLLGVYLWIANKQLLYRLLHKWGFSPKVPRKRFVNTALKEEKNSSKIG